MLGHAAEIVRYVMQQTITKHMLPQWLRCEGMLAHVTEDKDMRVSFILFGQSITDSTPIVQLLAYLTTILQASF